MTSFVVCNSLLLIFGNNFISFFKSTYYSVNCIKKILFFNKGFTISCSNQSSLITNICNICT